MTEANHPTREAIKRAGFDVVSSDEITSELGDLSLRVLTLEDELARVKKKRDQLVATAVGMNLPRGEIAWASNLSRQRVHSIAQSHRNR